MLDEIINFILKYIPKRNDIYANIPDIDDLKEKLKEKIAGYINYNCCIVLSDEKGIYAVALWNIKRAVAFIEEVIVEEKHRNMALLKKMLCLGWKRWPHVKYICFIRGRKYKDRNYRYYRITDFLKRRS